MPTYVCVVKAGLLNHEQNNASPRRLPGCTARPLARQRGSSRSWLMKTNSVNVTSTAYRRIARSGSAPTFAPEEPASSDSG